MAGSAEAQVNPGSFRSVGFSPQYASATGCAWAKAHATSHRAGILAVVLAAVALLANFASAGPLDEMSLDRWKKLREAERYQLNIAEKYFRENNFKVALTEYEKFLTLHEKSEGAPFAQYKWSLCQVQLKKLNTAVKEGFQSVIDYWPDSPESLAAAYSIARAYKDMGDVKQAKKAYGTVLAKHGGHLVAVLSRVDLAEIARIEGDEKRRVALWQELVFQTDRKDGAEPYCQQAAVNLAAWQFAKASFPEGLKALATNYTPEQLPYYISYYANGPLQTLTNMAETKAGGEKLADEAAEYIRKQIPADRQDEAKKTYARQCGFYMADLYWASKRPEKCREIYEQQLKELGPADDTLGRLAGWYKSMNRREEARKTYGQFAKVHDGQGQIAYMFREERRYPEAVTLYRELIQADTKNANLWQGELAHALREGGQYKEAIGAYRLWDNSPNNLWHMAGCHRALKEHKEAVGLYQQILATEKSWAPQAQLQVGYTYEEAGEKEAAIKSLQLVCKRYPKTGEASQAHAHLQNQYKINQTFGGDAGKDE